MNDYPNRAMYTQEGLSGLACQGSRVITILVVSPFDSDRTEEQNVVALRDLSKGLKANVDLVYGQDFGIIVASCYEEQVVPAVRKRCEEIVRECHQPGYVEWDGKRAEFVAVDGTRSPLPPWDKTTECLNAWGDKLRPGFKAEGFFGGGMSFVQRKHWEYKKKHGLLPERVEVPEPLTARERQFFALALEYAGKLGLDAEAVVSRLSFKVAPEEVKKALGE